MKIQKAPDVNAISNASGTLNSWHLHYFQLLYSNDLTQPSNGRPFKVELSINYHPILKIVCQQNTEYSFNIGWIKSENQDDYDKEVLEKCNLILRAIPAGKNKVNHYACCPLSKPGNCVCSYKDECPIHGTRCNGTHD